MPEVTKERDLLEQAKRLMGLQTEAPQYPMPDFYSEKAIPPSNADLAPNTSDLTNITAKPYNEEAEALRRRADALEAQAKPQVTMKPWESALQAGVEGFNAGFTGAPSHASLEAQRGAAEHQRQQDLFARAKDLRSNAQQQQLLGSQEGRAEATLAETRQQHLEQQRHNEQLENAPKFEHFGDAQSGETYGIFSPQGGGSFRTVGKTPGQPKLPTGAGSYTDPNDNYHVVRQNPDGNLQDVKIGPARKPASMAGLDMAGQASPEFIEMGARTFLQTKQFPQVGSGAAGVMLRTKMGNRAAQLDPTAAPAVNAAMYQADNAALTQNTKMLHNIQAFEATAKQNLSMALQLAKPLIDSGSPLLNRPLRAGSAGLGGTDVAAFNAALQVASTEVAKVVTSANLNGILSDNARNEFSKILDPNATYGQLVAAVNVVLRDMDNRKNNLIAENQAIQSNIRAGSQFGQQAPNQGGGAEQRIGPNGKPAIRIN